MMADSVLLDVPLVPDVDQDGELGPADVGVISDHELKDCRLLITRRSVEGIEIGGEPGGLLKLGCSFQASHGTRFEWARVVLTVDRPEGATFVDVAPAVKLDDRAVKFTVDVEGKLKVEYAGLESGISSKTTTEFDIYYCSVHGTGAGTAKGRWEFEENPKRRDGLGKEQPLFVTLRATGPVRGNVSVYAKIVREGAAGVLDGMRYLVVGADQHHAPLTFDIPRPKPIELESSAK